MSTRYLKVSTIRVRRSNHRGAMKMRWLFGRRDPLRRFLEALKHGDLAMTTSRSLADLLCNQCPWCKKDLSGHEWTLLAVLRFDPHNTAELNRQLGDEDWNCVISMSELALEVDSIQAFVIACPDRSGGWLLRRSPLEYLLRAEVLSSKEISESGFARLESATRELGLVWTKFCCVLDKGK